MACVVGCKTSGPNATSRRGHARNRVFVFASSCLVCSAGAALRTAFHLCALEQEIESSQFDTHMNCSQLAGLISLLSSSLHRRVGSLSRPTHPLSPSSTCIIVGPFYSGYLKVNKLGFIYSMSGCVRRAESKLKMNDSPSLPVSVNRTAMNRVESSVRKVELCSCVGSLD